MFWSFYEGDASFERFVNETLEYLSLRQAQRPATDRTLSAQTAFGASKKGTVRRPQQIDALLHHLAQPGTLSFSTALSASCAPSTA
ncbi:MAG: hypothetical protein R2911_35160 [Caldilineaceae bacterium]